VLNGVPIEASSDPSGLDIDSVRVFRLSDDLFFFSRPGFGPDILVPTLGEPSAAIICEGVAGEGVMPVPMGLVAMSGEGCAMKPWAPMNRDSDPSGLKTESGNICASD